LVDFLDGKQLYVSVITEMELLSFKGLLPKEEKQIQLFLSECKVVGINTAIKKEAIRIRRTCGNKLPDSIIAATSIYIDVPLITADSGFKRIKELTLIYYAK